MRKFFTSTLFFIFFGLLANAQVNHVVISAFYGGGSNSNALYKYDFVELFNPTNAPVTFNEWTIQYASAAGTAWQKNKFSGTIGAGKYYLLQLATQVAPPATQIGADLPTPDSIITVKPINFSATNGKVALVSDTFNLVGATVSSPSIIDLLGFGTATAFETAAAPAAGNRRILLRINGGCTDNNDNSKDFALDSVLVPRNSASPANTCVGLPVKLVSFAAQQSYNQVNLSWKTASEINFSHFEIEKSIDGIRYNTLGSVRAYRNNEGGVYQFADVAYQNKNSYYRLKLVDNNGSFSYGNTLQVKSATKDRLYINSTSSTVVVNHPLSAKPASIAIVSFDGRIIMKQSIAVGSSQTKISAQKLGVNNCIVVYESDEIKIVEKLIK